MILKDIFSKAVDRPIEGVIKADDAASLRLEVEEYVLTREVEKSLEQFLSAYNNYNNANGVWVSGFFGSGKSHLLKILALLIENKEIDGYRVLDLFLPKCGDNAILRGDLQKAAAIPSKSILFNIDQKADVISKTQIDALLAVFMKVFDEMCGYYGKQGHIAQFERHLDSRGQYTAFLEAYKAIAGKDWQTGREQALLERANVAKACAKATGEDESLALGIIEKYRTEYKVSIEDFADTVHKYIESQGPQFRLNFFVDEVGQYIADNTKLMTNLQTIAESLATKSRGRAWVLVTAQEEMDSVLGEMNKKQANDFTKIQARFKNRMKLTSQNVDEVIQKRLLQKNEAGEKLLANVYGQEHNNFRTLFDFTDGSHTYRNFLDAEHFINCYPFIPYQFGLFQSAIQGLSQHNAFEGKHSSVGERSMLGVFQQVAVQIANLPVGELATFDRMFEGIRTALKSQIQKAILQAENNLENPFAIRVLKALFLVKYVKEFKPTLRNLCVLMLPGFDASIPALHKRVEEALNVLEGQSYIQRNGERYEYLTDEEKDVEEEIKGTEVENSAIMATLEDLIFNRILKEKKVRYSNGQDYPFARKLDDHTYGRDEELAINVISPFHEHAGSEAILQSQNMGKSEMLVLMPDDGRLMQDLLMLKRTEKYFNQNYSLAQQESRKRILTEKKAQNAERENSLLQRVQDLLGKSPIVMYGSVTDNGEAKAQTRIFKAFEALIGQAYPNLSILRDVTYDANDIPKYVRQNDQGILDDSASKMSEAETEVFSYITRCDKAGERVSLQKTLEGFSHKPYGWPDAATLCLLAKLCARGKVELRMEGRVLEDAAEMARALQNSKEYSRVLLTPQIDFNPTQVRALKTLHEALFEKSGVTAEARPLAKETADALSHLVREVQTLLERQDRFPFVAALQPFKDLLSSCLGKPHGWYITDFVTHEAALLDMKEDVFEPIRAFMNTPQRDIYQNATRFLREQAANLGSLSTPESRQHIDSLHNTLSGNRCYRSGVMQGVKTTLDALQEQVDAMLASGRQEATATLACLQAELCAMPEYTKVPTAVQQNLLAQFALVEKTVAGQHLLPVLRDTMHRFENEGFHHLLNLLLAEASKEAQASKGPAPGTVAAPSPKAMAGGVQTVASPITTVGHGMNATAAQGMNTVAPAITTVSNTTLPSIVISLNATKVPFAKTLLASEEDVEDYLNAMRTTLLAAITQGKRIKI